MDDKVDSNLELQDPVIEEPAPAGKKKRKLSIILAVLLVVSLTANAVLGYSYYKLNSYIEEYDTVFTDLYFHFDSLTVDSFKEKVDSGEEFIVMITRPNCPNCAALEQPFIELAEKQGIADKIYHLNVVLLRRDSEAWAEFKEIYGFEGTPTFARFAGGEQVSCVGWTYENGISYEMVEEWIAQQGDFWS